MNRRERIGWLMIILGVLLLALLLLNLFGASLHATNLYIEPDEHAFLLEECDKNFVGPCQLYALPRQAAPEIFDAIHPYRSKP